MVIRSGHELIMAGGYVGRTGMESEIEQELGSVRKLKQENGLVNGCWTRTSLNTGRQAFSGELTGTSSESVANIQLSSAKVNNSSINS